MQIASRRVMPSRLVSCLGRAGHRSSAELTSMALAPRQGQLDRRGIESPRERSKKEPRQRKGRPNEPRGDTDRTELAALRSHIASLPRWRRLTKEFCASQTQTHARAGIQPCSVSACWREEGRREAWVRLKIQESALTGADGAQHIGRLNSFRALLRGTCWRHVLGHGHWTLACRSRPYRFRGVCRTSSFAFLFQTRRDVRVVRIAFGFFFPLSKERDPARLTDDFIHLSTATLQKKAKNSVGKTESWA